MASYLSQRLGDEDEETNESTGLSALQGTEQGATTKPGQENVNYLWYYDDEYNKPIGWFHEPCHRARAIALMNRKRAQEKTHVPTEIELLADEMHKMRCRWNHTDGCGYFYTEWPNRPMEDRRLGQQLLAMCKREGVAPDALRRIIEFMRETDTQKRLSKKLLRNKKEKV